MKGMLLAAGLGTRFRPHTLHMPKPTIPLLNVPIAFYSLHALQQLGMKHLVVNTHYLPDQLRAVFNHLKNPPTTVIFSDETQQILGTGGAIRNARSSLEGSGTFCVSNADMVLGFSLKDAWQFHLNEKPMATMVVMEHPEAGKKYGAVWVTPNQYVVGIGRERPNGAPESAKPFHFTGIHFIEERIFKYIPDGPCDINRDVYLPAITTGEKVMACVKSGFWFDTGSIDDYLFATHALLEILPRLQHQPFFLSLFRRFWSSFDRRPHLWEGEGCEHLLNLGPHNLILLGNKCRIHPTAKIRGFAVFGDGIEVERHAVLENVVVLDHTRIPPDYQATRALIGPWLFGESVGTEPNPPF